MSGGRPDPVPRSGDAAEADGTEADGTDARAPAPAGADAAVRCDLCGGPMLGRHCKLVCRTCGYQRDCSDP